MSDTCERHPDRQGFLSIDLPSIRIKRYWCLECRTEYDERFTSKGFGRAYGTGLGSAAHAEAQESGRLQREYDDAKPHSETRRYL